MLCLIIGLGYSMAFTTLVVGHLNILTITFAPILIGLAIDFGIHFITRYEEETRHGRSEEAALDKAMVFTGQGIVTGALTTAGAFVAMWLTDFKGIQEMGIISGGGLALSLVPMMTLLPVLLMGDRGDQGRMAGMDSGGGHRPPLQGVGGAALAAEVKRAQIEQTWLRRPGWVMAATGVLCVVALTQFDKVKFDYNLLNMQSKGLASVVYEKKLLYSGQSILYAAVVADSEKQACEFEQAAKKLPSVASVDGDDKGDSIYAYHDQRRVGEIGNGAGDQERCIRISFRAGGPRPGGFARPGRDPLGNDGLHALGAR